MTTTDKTLLWISRIGVFCIPFIPLIVSGSMFFPFITGKNFAFRIIVEIIFAAWLLLALRAPLFRLKRSYLLYAFSAFLFIMLLADAFGANPFKSFWSNYERMEGFVTLAHLFLYFIVASSVLSTERWWIRFFNTSVGVTVLLGFYGILQIAGKFEIHQGGTRLDGTLGNAAYFAGYMLFHFFLTLFLLARPRVSTLARYGYGLALFLQLLVLYYSATRGAAVGLVGGLFLAALLISLLDKTRPRLRRWALGSLVALLLLVGTLYAVRETKFVTNSPVLTRFASISLEAAGPRFMVWGMAFQGFKERPLFGWGQENFNFVFNKYYDPHMWAQEQWFDRTHNVIFDWLIAGGLLGLLAYLSLFVVALYSLWRHKGTGGFTLLEKSIFTGLLVAYFVHNFFVFDNLTSYLLFFSFLAFLHLRAVGEVHDQPTHLPPVSGGFYALTVFLCLCLGVSLYFVNLRSILTATDLIDGLKPQAGGAADNLKVYERALSRNSFALQEIAEQLTQTSVRVIGNADVSAEVKNGFANLTFSALSAMLERVPDDARMQVFTGSFLSRLNQSEKALPYLEKAHELSPTKQAISFDLAGTYLTLNRNADALPILKKAFEDAPEYDSARISYAVVAVYNNRFDIVKEVLEPRYETIAVPDDRLVKAYYDVKRYDLVLAVWKGRVATEPTNVQYHISLAAAYLLIGAREQAVLVLQEAQKLNPANAKEIEQYISEIRAGRNP